MQFLVSTDLWYEAPSITRTTLSRHVAPYFKVSDCPSFERNIIITFSSVLHYVCASQTGPSDEIATIMLTLWPIGWSGSVFSFPTLCQLFRLKSVTGIHDSSMFMMCYLSLYNWSIFRAYKWRRTLHRSELPTCETLLTRLKLKSSLVHKTLRIVRSETTMLASLFTSSYTCFAFHMLFWRSTI